MSLDPGLRKTPVLLVFFRFYLLGRVGDGLCRIAACRRERKSDDLLYGGRGAPVGGIACGNRFAGSALHPQGTMSLDPVRRKSDDLLFEFGFRLSAKIALRQ